jgi:hypothetical protein
MTGFVQLGARATLQDVISARRNDAAVVSYLIGSVGRNRTGLRDLPANELETIQGDVISDYFYDYTNGYFYKLTDNSGILQWVRIAIEATFTNP